MHSKLQCLLLFFLQSSGGANVSQENAWGVTSLIFSCTGLGSQKEAQSRFYTISRFSPNMAPKRKSRRQFKNGDGCGYQSG